MSEKNRIGWIDAARAVGMIAIVLGHTLRGEGIYIWLYSFHVPLCVMLSGMVFSPKNAEFGAFVKRKFETRMIPYYFFALVSIAVYAVIGTSVESAVDPVQKFVLHEQLAGMLWANGHSGLMRWNLPLWYVPMIFLMECTGWILVKKVGVYEKKRRWGVLAVSVAVGCVLYHAVNPWDFPLSAETMLYLLPFFLMGEDVKRLVSSDRISAPVRVLAGIVMMAAGAYVSSLCGWVDYVVDRYNNYPLFVLSAALTSVGILFLCSALTFLNKPLGYIGRNTMGILLMHKFPIMFFISVFPATANLAEEYPMIGSALIAMASLALCLMASAVLKRIMPWSLGMRKYHGRIE